MMWLYLKLKLRNRGMYIVEQGDWVGCFLLHIKEERIFNAHAFLMMPDPVKPIYLSDKELYFYLKTKTMKLEKVIPKDIYEVSKANFIHLKKGK